MEGLPPSFVSQIVLSFEDELKGISVLSLSSNSPYGNFLIFIWQTLFNYFVYDCQGVCVL